MYMTEPTIINLHPNEYIEVLRYYPFAVNLGRSMRSFDTLSYLSNKVSARNKTRDLNLIVFNR